MDDDEKVRVIVRMIIKIVIFLLVLFIAFLIFDLNKLEEIERRIVAVPIILGTVSLVFGYDMTGSGFYARYHYIDKGTPGCVWVAFGIICWVFAIWFYLAEASS